MYLKYSFRNFWNLTLLIIVVFGAGYFLLRGCKQKSGHGVYDHVRGSEGRVMRMDDLHS